MIFGRGKHAKPLPADSTEKGKGYIAANISIKEKSLSRQVSIIVIDCGSGAKLYKATYDTKARSDFAAHETAIDLIRKYAAEENYLLQDDPTSNSKLPTFTSDVRRGGRW